MLFDSSMFLSDVRFGNFFILRLEAKSIDLL